MPLLNQEQLAKGFLDSTEKHFDAEVGRLKSDIDNLLVSTVGIDDHQRIDNALADLFDRIAAEKDKLEAVREYRQERSL